MKSPCISIIIPCYNEEKIIQNSADRLLNILPKVADHFEIIFCNDGSTDKTGQILDDLRQRYSCIKVTGYEHNRGAGFALRNALAIARGAIVVHMDADLAMDPETLCRESIRRLKNCDIVIASRYSGTRAEYPLRRRLPSMLYKWTYRRLFGLSIDDAMSGFFGMRRTVLDYIDPLEMSGFEIYLELFVKAEKSGLTLDEYPQKFVHDSTSGEVSVFSTAPRQLINTLKLWWRLPVSNS